MKKKNEIIKICFSLLLCGCLILSNMACLPESFSYATTEPTNVSTYIKDAQFYINVQTIRNIELAGTESDASTNIIPDTSAPQIRIYPTEEGKKSNYYCKLSHWNTSKKQWETAQQLNKALKGGGSTDYANFLFTSPAIKKYLETGSKHQFKLELNTKSSNGDTVETYYFNLIRSVGLLGVSAQSTDGQPLPVTTQTGSKYVIACLDDTLNLTCTAKTPNYAKITVAGTEVESGSAYSIDLTRYEETTNGQKEIPVNVAYAGDEGTGQGTAYTILVEKTDYTPKVTTSYNGIQPEDEKGYNDATKRLNCDKDTVVTMSVQ